MASTALRLRASRRVRRLPRASVEEAQARVALLVLERQRLREAAAPAAALERNRLQIVRAQWQLSYALVARHVPAAPAAA